MASPCHLPVALTSVGLELTGSGFGTLPSLCKHTTCVARMPVTAVPSRAIDSSNCRAALSPGVFPSKGTIRGCEICNRLAPGQYIPTFFYNTERGLNQWKCYPVAKWSHGRSKMKVLNLSSVIPVALYFIFTMHCTRAVNCRIYWSVMSRRRLMRPMAMPVPRVKPVWFW